MEEHERIATVREFGVIPWEKEQFALEFCGRVFGGWFTLAGAIEAALLISKWREFENSLRHEHKGGE